MATCSFVDGASVAQCTIYSATLAARRKMMICFAPSKSPKIKYPMGEV